MDVCGGLSVWETDLAIHSAHAPPYSDTCNMPGGRMHIIELHGRADNLTTCIDDVHGEGPDGWVSPAYEKVNT
jgi:hypothetical protein